MKTVPAWNLAWRWSVTSTIDFYGNFDLDLGIVDSQGQIAKIQANSLKRFLVM